MRHWNPADPQLERLLALGEFLQQRDALTRLDAILVKAEQVYGDREHWTSDGDDGKRFYGNVVLMGMALNKLRF